MDHGRFGPKGAMGGADGGLNQVQVLHADGRRYVPPHLSKDQDIQLAAGDVVAVSTPGGGGFGPPAERDPLLIERDVARGYYQREDALRRFGTNPKD
jgi:N-methylhydantoinase B